jgi:hypothetical protein
MSATKLTKEEALKFIELSKRAQKKIGLRRVPHAKK